MNKNELIESQKKLLADAQSVIKSAKTENRELNGEEKAKVEAIFADADKIEESVRSLNIEERAARLEASLRQPVRQTAEVRSADQGDDQLRQWAMGGRGQPETISVRALGVGTASAGGYTTVTNFSSSLEKFLRYFMPVEQAVDVFGTADGNDYKWPTVDDTANAAQGPLAEAGTITAATDPSFGQVTFKSWDYYSPIVKISNQLIRDSVVDFPSLLAEMFAERMAVSKEAAVVSANAGTSAPEGVLHGVTVGNNLASGNAITVAKLLDLQNSVPVAYRSLPDNCFVMHDGTFQAIRALVDTTGRFLFNTDLQSGVSKQLLGWPVYISNSMTSIASPGDNQPLILAGATKKYKLRNVGGPTLTRLNEMYAATGQVGFVLHQAWDGRYVNVNGVRTLNSYDS